MLRSILYKNKWWVLFTSLCIILSSLMMVYAGYSLSFLFRAINYSGNALNKLLNDALNVTIIWIIALILLYIKNIAKANMIRKIRKNLRNNIALKIVELNYEEFHKKDSGNYVSWLTSDVQQITQQAFIPFFTIVENIATTIFSLIAMIKLNLFIGLTAIGLFVFISVIPQLLGKLMTKVSKELSIGQEKFVEKTKETVMGYTIFKLYNLFSAFVERVNHSSDTIENINFQYSRKQSLVETFVAGVNLIGQVVLIVVTLYLAIENLTPVGAVLSVGNLAGSFFSGVGASVNSIISLKASKIVFEKFKLKKNGITSKVDLNTLESITLEDISFSYSDTPVLKNINIKFERGKKYALVGASGKGKSTLAKILLGFLSNYSGKVLFDNNELKEVLQSSIYRQITYIDQNTYLFNGTIRNNINLGEDFSDNEIYEALKKSSLLDFINNLPQGLDTIIEENGKNLSGGQRQRLALARAIIRKVQFIIIDEGTSAIDKESALEIERNLMDDKNLTIILITHNLHNEIIDKLDCVYEI
ncbi:ABC transporter ATP-binding protein [Tissierella pigra]|uniref:ABC transporter ATP-binding protein n=1 Tax=Tissierella pigra TaxID=2607614 RepID=A0A6N7XYD0_9FIRM|nr:ABC transporter ATP-binding protein [Tissierella pigra]MSU01268.1 ABC transporter ATP-binding protein [Tissierella pigra]